MGRKKKSFFGPANHRVSPIELPDIPSPEGLRDEEQSYAHDYER